MRQIMFYTFVLHLISLAVGVRVRHRMHIRGSARVKRRASVGKHGAVWAPVQHGGELHKDTSIESRAPDLPPAVRELLLAVAPETRPCRCTNHSWDQYVVCEDAVQNASSAWSFGINGYDYWGQHINWMKSKLIPKTFDCYDPHKPSFPNDFSKVCLGAREENVSGHRFTTLAHLLHSTPGGSALVKMDIEASEFEVLPQLRTEDFRRISSLNVEYHFNGRCPSSADVINVTKTLAWVNKHLAVVDGAAGYYGQACMVDGVGFPKLFAVSYSAREFCDHSA